MGNVRWLDLFPSAALKNGVAPISDHSPIILQTLANAQQQRITKFRFENRWLRESELGDVVKNSLEVASDFSILDKLTALSSSLSDWSKRLSRELFYEKRRLEHLIELLHENTDSHSISRVIDAKRKLIDILLKEEIAWKQ